MAGKKNYNELVLTSATLYIPPHELEVAPRGDVNGDGYLTAADVTALVNYILGRGTLVNQAAAYVNDDDKIDIADVAALISLIRKQ